MDKLAPKSSIHAVFNHAGDCLYLTSDDTTAQMATVEGYRVTEIAYYGEHGSGAAKALFQEDELVAAIDETLPTLPYAVREGADGAGYIKMK